MTTSPQVRRTLVAGWFSFEDMGASAGDLLARDVVCDWLRNDGHGFDIATAAPFTGGVDWHAVDPGRYSHVVFVCGPFGNGPPVVDFLKRFAACRLIGVNLTMLQPLAEWNPFQNLFERDSSRTARPDLAFLSRAPRVPLVGLILIDAQPEYRLDRHERVDAVIRDFIATREMAIVDIDTRLDHNRTGLRTAAEVESLVAKLDLVITTRLHGTVLALKNGVPALAIDAVEGGAKITRQTQALQWPVLVPALEVSVERLGQAFDYCLTSHARTLAAQCRDKAVATLHPVQEQFLLAIRERG